MKSDMKIILGVIVASIAIVGGAIFFMGGAKAGPKLENVGASSMTIDKKLEDFGDMKSDEERTAVFTIANTSANSVLRIWNVSTSCDCTFATVTIGNETTPEFNMPMHMIPSLKNWIGEIPAGQTAILNVTYRPKVMPVTGPVSRQTRFATNDPNNQEVEVSVTANVL